MSLSEAGGSKLQRDIDFIGQLKRAGRETHKLTEAVQRAVLAEPGNEALASLNPPSHEKPEAIF